MRSSSGFLFVGFYLASGCALTEASLAETALDVCEAYLKETLVAPATYQRVWAKFEPKNPISFEEFLASHRQRIADQEANFANLDVAGRGVLAYSKQMTAYELLEMFKQSGWAEPGANGSATLQYDAANKLGVPIRGYYVCRLSNPGKQNFETGSVYAGRAMSATEGASVKLSSPSSR